MCISWYNSLQRVIGFIILQFLAYPMVQQVLSAFWLGDFIKWPRLHFYQKICHVFVRALLFPIICIALLLAPQGKILKKLQAPVNRFLLNLASYILFLFFVFLLNYLDTGNFSRGPPRTGMWILKMRNFFSYDSYNFKSIYTFITPR